DEVSVPQQTLNIRRVRAISGRLFERIRVKNYNAYAVSLDLEFELGADFSDIFEVRGMVRTSELPRPERPSLGDRQVVFQCVGADEQRRRTIVRFALTPDRLELVEGSVFASFRLHLGPYQTRLVGMTIEPAVSDDEPAVEFDAAVHGLRRSYEDWDRGCTQ